MLTVQLTTKDGQSREDAVVEEIRRFEEWFKAYLDNVESLTKPECAILRTFIYWKVEVDRD